MNTHIDFTLNSEKKIEIIIPDLLTKFNYFYEPTENIHKFDEATVFFKINNDSLKIQQEDLGGILTDFNYGLQQALSKTISLPAAIKPGEAGRALNFMLNNLTDADLRPFWTWSTSFNISTLIYNQNDKIYLEITPDYPWTTLEPESGDNYITFDEFIKQYKPYVFEEIPYYVAMQWAEKSYKYLDLIDYLF